MSTVDQVNMRSAVSAPPSMKEVMSEKPKIANTETSLIIDTVQDIYQQAVQAFRQLGREVPESPFRKSEVKKEMGEVKSQYKAMMMASKHSSDQYSRIPDPVADGRGHIAGIRTLIDDIHSGYQKKYGEVVKASTQYMQDMNTALGKMSSHIKAGSDGKIHFKPEALLKDIDEVAQKYSGVAYSGSGAGAYFGQWEVDLNKATPLVSMRGSQKEFEFWEKKLSGQGFIVKYQHGDIKVFPDMKPIKEIYKTITNSSASWDGSDIAASELQSIQTAIDAQKNAVNSSVSRLLETFRQDNSHFETLVQLLIQLIKDLNQNNNSLINM